MNYRNVVKSHYPIIYRPLSGGVASALDVINTPIFFENISASSGSALSTFINAGSYTMGAWFFLYGAGPATATTYNRRQVMGDSGQYASITYGVNDAVESTCIMTATNFHGGTTFCGANVPLYKPFHFAATWDGSVMKVYVDGVLRGSQPGSNPSTLTNAFGVGRMGGTTSGMERIWGAGVWNTALSAGDIMTWVNGTVPGSPRGYWPMNEASASGGTASTCFNVGGTAGINLALSATYRTEDSASWSVVGTVDQNSTPLLPAYDGYGSTYLDGYAANYVLGGVWMEQSAGTHRAPYTNEFWIKLASAASPATTIFSTGNSIYINRYLLDAKVLNVTTNNATDNKTLCNFELKENETYHVIVQNEYRANQVNRPSITWINGRRIGNVRSNTIDMNGAPNSALALFSSLLLGQKAVTNQSTIVSGAGMIGNIQEFAMYRRLFDDNMALQHYLAGVNEVGEPPQPICIKAIDSTKILASFTKPVFLKSIDNVQCEGLTFSDWKSYENGDLELELYTKTPITYLKLDDSSSVSFLDSSGNGNTATGYGTLVPLADGAIGSSVLFSSAADGYIDVPTGQLFKDSGGDWSVSVWLKPRSVISGMTILGNYFASSTLGWDLKTTTANVLQTRVGQNGSVTTATHSSVQPGHWSMITLVYRAYGQSNFLLEVWKNDELIGTSAAAFGTRPTPYYNGVLRLGNSASAPTAADRFDGYMDDLKVFDVALKESDIKTLYRHGLVGLETPIPNIQYDGYTYNVNFDGYVTDASGQSLGESQIAFDFEFTAELGNGPPNMVTLDTSDIVVTNANINRTRYYMRAYNTSILQYVYWSTTGAPDFEGASSGYSTAVLQDVVEIGRSL